MTPILYIVGYLFAGAALVGVLTGLDKVFFEGKDGDNMMVCMALMWPVAVAGFLMWGVYWMTKESVVQVKKFLKV